MGYQYNMSRSKKAEETYEASGNRPGVQIKLRVDEETDAKIRAKLKPGQTRQEWIMNLIGTRLR